MNKIIVFLLAVLGFSFATKQSAAQYGAPIDFYDLVTIQGRVVDKQNKPIKDFVVVSNNDTTLTNQYGQYYFSYNYTFESINRDTTLDYYLQYKNIYGKEDDFIPKDTILHLKIRETANLRKVKMIRRENNE